MKKRSRTSVDSAIVDVWKREVGQLSSRNFAHRLAASEDLVLRLDILRKLDRHRGCVNTVSFNADGDILVSGSDDRRVILWDWETGNVKLSFHSGHHNNVFQAKYMPYSEDRSIVTCAADGQVRHAQIQENGKVETKFLGKHHGRAHKLAIEPGSPHIFYTCGEDGMVQHIDLRTGIATKLFTCKSHRKKSYSPVVHLNAIAMDPRNPNLFSVAGSDEFARLYDIRKYKWDGTSDFGQPVDCFCPSHLFGNELVGITGLAFSDRSELLVSYNDEFIYLFARDMGLGPNPTPPPPVSSDSDAGESSTEGRASPSNVDSNANVGPRVFKGHRNCETVKGVNFFGPKCEYVVSGSDCGRIFIWRKKDGELIRVMEADKDVVNCVEPHPHATVLASSGIESDIKIWIPKAMERATLPTNIEKVIRDRHHFFSFGEFYGEDDDGAFFYNDDGEDDEDEDEDDEDDDDDDDEDEDEDEDEDDDDESDEDDFFDYSDEEEDELNRVGSEASQDDNDENGEGGEELNEFVDAGDCNVPSDEVEIGDNNCDLGDHDDDDNDCDG